MAFFPSPRSTPGKPPAGQQSQSARDVALRDFLIRLRDLWRRNYPEVPRLGRSEDFDQEKGIDKDLAEVLSMDGLSSSYSMRNLMGRHYLEHLWVFLSAEFFLDVWGAVVDEPPPEPQAPEDEEPPPDLSPQERIAWIRARQQERLAFTRAHQRWVALIEARRQRLAIDHCQAGLWLRLVGHTRPAHCCRCCKSWV